MNALLVAATPSIKRFTGRMCRTPAEAEDAAQDTLLAITQHLSQFEGRSSFSTWLFTLARTACNRRLRGQKHGLPRQDAPEDRADEADDPEALAARREVQLSLELALRSLHREQREVVLLRDVEGLSAIEAAEVLGVSVEALKSRLHRARAALRGAMRPVVEGGASTGCPDVETLMSQKHEGELDEPTCSKIERHVSGCARCRALCAGLREVLGECAALRDGDELARQGK